ncbi:hypothetical protein HU200_028898 [Digitaria exilis]|uniref:Uncharacterized protein n=1 Tax=Digitaria exilis TaxID=1010633 RepID=A0A835BUU1_9POAL|nr:hypothetical protein HU200_028898 [Digitaria exilis]
MADAAAAAPPPPRADLMPPPPPPVPPTTDRRPRRRAREVSSRYLSTPIPSTPRLSTASSTRLALPDPVPARPPAGGHALRQREPTPTAAAAHGHRRAQAGRAEAVR